MKIYGRLIGVIAGSLLAGPVGVLLGFMLGYYFDLGLSRQSIHQLDEQARAQQAFFYTTFSVMGHIAKADGRVNEHEIGMAEQVMVRLGLSAASRREAIRLFTLGKQPDFDLQKTIRQFKKRCANHTDLFRIFIDIQLQAAYSDNHLSENERWILRFICQQLGFNNNDFRLFNENYRAKRAYKQRPTKQQKLHGAYRILGVSPKASGAEIKKAYRILISQNHPDKLVSKGLPEEMMKLATKKTQAIQTAYDQIKHERKL